MNRRLRHRVFMPMLCVLMACLVSHAHADETPAGTAAHGRRIYSERQCSLCHAITPAQEEGSNALLRAGHPLAGAPYRGTWWNGKVTTDAGDASDQCLKTFIDPNSEGFEAAERKALILFMQSLGSETGVSPLTLLRRDSGDVDMRTGDADRGRDLYRRACVSCHGGDDSAATDAFVRKTASALSPGQIANLIRKGSRQMPFFQIDRLTAAQVADIAVYIESQKVSR